MPEKVVCFDTNIVIYVMRELIPNGNYSPVDRELTSRAKTLREALDFEGARVMIPTVVVAEYLTGPIPEPIEATLAQLLKIFETSPFDLKAAAIAAKLRQFPRELAEGEPPNRNVIKADIQIIATAKAFGATDYYSHDKHSRRLAEHVGLRAYDLPE